MYNTLEDFEEAVEAAGEALEGIADDPETIFWDKSQPNKVNAEYKEPIVWPIYIEWTPAKLTAFKRLFKKEFGLAHDIRWVGVVTTLKTPGVPGTGGREDAVFLIHEEDKMVYSSNYNHLGTRSWMNIVSNGDAQIYPKHSETTTKLQSSPISRVFNEPNPHATFSNQAVVDFHSATKEANAVHYERTRSSIYYFRFWYGPV